MDYSLRAHHIFCIQGFRGKGYNEKFVSNMTSIVEQLNSKPNCKIRILNQTDCICDRCPQKIDVEEKAFACESEAKVMRLDSEVINVLQLEVDGVYEYSELKKRISENLTSKSFARICSTCQWYSLGYCREGLLGK